MDDSRLAASAASCAALTVRSYSARGRAARSGASLHVSTYVTDDVGRKSVANTACGQ